MAAFAASHPPEVEAQRGHVLRLEGLGHAKDDLEVHDPALEGMRVADHGRRLRLVVGKHEDRFEATRGPREVEGLVGRHEGIMQDETVGHAGRPVSSTAPQAAASDGGFQGGSSLRSGEQ